MYLELGVTHIADLNGYDHILFLISLVAAYQWSDWKKLLKLITAFTLGHSISLTLSVLNVVQFSTALIELIIPFTIVIGSAANFWSKSKSHQYYNLEYSVSAVFGLIHGLGFSVLLKSLLGQETSILKPLFAFNLGLELGQITIVSIILSLSWVIVRFFTLRAFYWTLAQSILALAFSIKMIWERWLW